MYSDLPIERTSLVAGDDLLRTCLYLDPAGMYTYGERPDQVPSWKAQGGCRKRVFWAAKNLRALTEPQFDEQHYLLDYPDVATAVILGEFRSGWEHYRRYGRKELRLARQLPAPQLAVVPLVKWRSEFRFHTARHKFFGPTQPRETPDRAAILHLKYLSDFTDLANTEIQRGVKWNEASEYRFYQHAIQRNPAHNLHYSKSVRYESSETLMREGLVRASREFVRHFARRLPFRESNDGVETGRPDGAAPSREGGAGPSEITAVRTAISAR